MIDHLRSDKPSDSLENVEWEIGYTEEFAANLDHKNMIEKVLGYMETLPERDRTILTLRIWDDLSYEEISQITGESINNAKKIVSRTLTKIAANVEQLALAVELGRTMTHGCAERDHRSFCCVSTKSINRYSFSPTTPTTTSLPKNTAPII